MTGRKKAILSLDLSLMTQIHINSKLNIAFFFISRVNILLALKRRAQCVLFCMHFLLFIKMQNKKGERLLKKKGVKKNECVFSVKDNIKS